MPPATAIYVVYRTPVLDLDWIPPDRRVVVVHNDQSLDRSTVHHPGVLHVDAPGNVGFGAGVNLALGHLTTPRTVVANPDTSLRRDHWTALEDGSDEEIVTIPLVDSDRRPTSVVNRYPTPASLTLTAFRVGRLLNRDGALRHRLAGLLGPWGTDHARLMEARSGTWPITTHWVSGAVFSLSTERLHAVGGFDERFFLYLEDTDLCERLAKAYPRMKIVLRPVCGGMHSVQGSAPDAASRRRSDRHLLDSAMLLAAARTGPGWAAARAAIRARRALLDRPGP